MSEFVDVTLAFPTVLFSFAFVVVVGFWLFVLIGVADVDALDSGTSAAESGALIGVLPMARSARGVPVTIAVSLWIIASWLICAIGSIVFHETGVLRDFALLWGIILLFVAPVAAWLVTLLLVLPFGRFFDITDTESRNDFVGKTCVIRTQSVSHDFGQAEITSTDGSSSIIQVRLAQSAGSEAADLTAGARALVFDYDADGEHFLVTTFDLPTGPGGA